MNRFWVFDIVGNMWLPTEECVDGLFFVADVESFAEDDVTSGTMIDGQIFYIYLSEELLVKLLVPYNSSCICGA